MIALVLILLLQASAVPAGNISGTVIDAGLLPNRQPVFHARVQLGADALASQADNVIRTDEDGRFSFPNLRPGQYTLSIADDGYLRKTVTVTVTAENPDPGIQIGLDLAPTVYGRVYDPNNVPVSNILVEVIKVVYGPRGDRSVVTLESALTDDRGEYHLFWLDTGDYYIRASPVPPKDGNASIAALFAPTYYPGFRDPKDAAIVRLRAGANLGSLDAKLQPLTPINVGGSVSTLTGPGNTGVAANVIVAPAGAVATTRKYEGRSDPRYGFTIGGMPPGTYVISSEYLVDNQRWVVHQKVALKASDRSLILKLTPGVDVRGGMTMESGSAMDFRSMHVAMDNVDPDMPSPGILPADRNGQFVFSRVEPGDYAIRVVDLPGDLYVKSAQSGTEDILSKPLRMDFDAPEPIRMVLGQDGSRLSGVVVDRNDLPFADATVVLVPDAARENSPSEYRLAMSDDGGRFTIRGIRPGDYRLFAWQEIESNAYLNSGYLSDYRQFAVPLTIPASSAGSLSVRVIPGE